MEGRTESGWGRTHDFENPLSQGHFGMTICKLRCGWVGKIMHLGLSCPLSWLSVIPGPWGGGWQRLWPICLAGLVCMCSSSTLPRSGAGGGGVNMIGIQVGKRNQIPKLKPKFTKICNDQLAPSMVRRQANHFGKNRHLGGKWANKQPFPHKARHAQYLGLLGSPNTLLSQLAPLLPLAMGNGNWGFSGWGSQGYDSLKLGKSGDFPPTWHPERWQKIRPFAAEEPATFFRGSQAELPPTLQRPCKTLTVLSLIPTSCIQGQLEGLSPSPSKKGLDVHDVCIQHPHPSADRWLLRPPLFKTLLWPWSRGLDSILLTWRHFSFYGKRSQSVYLAD